MKKFKLMTGLLLASTLVLTGCNLLGGTSKKPKKKTSSTSSITTSVNPSSSGSGSSSGGEETVTVTSITADNPKTSYIVGEEFVKPKVTAQYSDSSLKDVSEYAVFSGYDMSIDGNQEVKVSYEENNVTVETSYTISVAPITVASIAISNQKVKYNVGDEFEKPTVTATYNDKSTKDVSAQATFSGYDMSKSGVQTVTVSFEEDSVKVSKTYDIRVLGTDWTEDEKTFLKENLNNNLLPFTSAIWELIVKDSGCQLKTPDTDQASVVATFEAAQGWEAAGVDSYGDPYYVYVIDGVGRVVVNVWANSSGYTIMDAVFQAKQSRTTDTEWPEAYQAFFNEFFEGETLPFYQFGENYEIYDSSLLEIVFYDYFDEDLREAYGGVLAENGYSPDPEVANKYSKAFEDGVMTISLDYTIDGGNGVFVVFEPVIHEATSWPEIPELAEIETYSSISVPHFTASKYGWYVRLGYVIIECETTSNLAGQYYQDVTNLGLICEAETDSADDVIGGSAFDWEEKISIEFNASGDYNDEYEFVPDGFSITVASSTPTSTFVEEWPAEYIATYLAQYEITENDIPTLAKPAGKDYKVKYLSFDEAYQELYEEYYFYIVMGWITEEQIAEIAKSYVGVYVSAYDPEGTGVEAYNALFNSSWEKSEETDEDTGEVLYTYWTKGRITVCVYGTTGVVYAQIMEPGEAPVEGSVTFLPSDTDPVDGGSAGVSATIEKDGVTVTSVGTITADQIRVFKNKTITISSEYTITKIEFTCTAKGDAKYGPGGFTASAGEYTYSEYVGTWTGSANSVTFTASSNQVRITSMTVYYEAEGGQGGGGGGETTVYNAAKVSADINSNLSAQGVSLTWDDENQEYGLAVGLGSSTDESESNLSAACNTLASFLPDYLVAGSSFYGDPTAADYEDIFGDGSIYYYMDFDSPDQKSYVTIVSYVYNGTLAAQMSVADAE